MLSKRAVSSRSERRSHLSRPTKRQSFSASSVGICSNLPVGGSLERTPLAQGRSAKFGFSVSPNLRLRLRAGIHQSTKCQNCAILPPAVPAEKRTMAYQRGSLKKVRRKEGETWMLRFRVTNAEGNGSNTSAHRTCPGLPKDRDAWREVDRLGLGVRINDAPRPGRVSFQFLAEHYLKADFGADAVRPKSVNTIPIVEHYVRDYLIERFGEQIAEDIKPLEIQKWLKSLNESNGLAWTTIAKMRGIMHRIYKVGILHEHVSKNPVQHVETRSKSSYRAIIITPAQTLAILKSLASPLHFALVLTCAATALRSSEILALRWSAYCGEKDESGFQSAGRRERTERRRRRHRTATSRCTRSWPDIFARGMRADAVREGDGFRVSVD